MRSPPDRDAHKPRPAYDPAGRSPVGARPVARSRSPMQTGFWFRSGPGGRRAELTQSLGPRKSAELFSTASPAPCHKYRTAALLRRCSSGAARIEAFVHIKHLPMYMYTTIMTGCRKRQSRMLHGVENRTCLRSTQDCYEWTGGQHGKCAEVFG